jgi:hypothetical protein
MKPDFSGDYVLDRDASAFGPSASAIVSARMRFTHDDPRFCCSARFASAADAMEFTFERFTDGRTASPGEQANSRCYWERDTIVSEDRMGSEDAAAVMTWRYELLDDGRRLRATEQIRGGGRDQDNVWEFERVRS